MRKKFVTVALLGTLIFTSTNFVGCSDYDDDIKNLQEQVDALKSISISDLASQLQSLKDANNNLGLANAKMEAAITEIKTNIEALKEADKTLTSLVNGKVDQATYQVAIKELNDKCSDLSGKLSALATLETAVNDLKLNKADKTTLDELKKAIEKLQSQDTEFATKISKLENTIETMNTVLAGKADQTTVAALSTAIEDLKKSVAGIDTKIATALDPIQQSIAKLQEDLAKKADAATIANDIEKAKSEIKAVTDALGARITNELAGVKAELSGRITLLETAKGQMDVQIGKLESNIDALKERISKLENQPNTDLTEVKAAITANQQAIAEAVGTIGSIQGTISGIENSLDGIGTEVGAVKSYIDNACTTLETTILSQVSVDITAAVAAAKEEYELADAGLSGRIDALDELLEKFDKTEYAKLQADFASLQTTVNGENGLIKQLADLNDRVGSLISEAIAATGEGTIQNQIAKQITDALNNSEIIKEAIDAAISSVTGRLDKVEADLDAVLERIQSIAFIPEYKDASGAIVPVYTINGVNGVVKMKFRVSPAEKATELAEAATKGNLNIFSFYTENELQTRAGEPKMTVTHVDGTVDGVITITATSTLMGEGSEAYFPVALKLATSRVNEDGANTSVNDVTTDYFNVRVRDINNAIFTLASIKDEYTVSNNTVAIDYTDTKVFNFAECLEVKYNNTLSLTDCGFAPVLKVAEVYDGTKWLIVGEDDNEIANIDVLKNRVFKLAANGSSIQLLTSDVGNRNKELKVRLADAAVFGDREGFELTYKVNADAEIKDVEYGDIVDNKLLDENGAKTSLVWAVGDGNKAQTFIISADKNKKFATTVTGASAADVIGAIAATATNKVTHTVNGESITVGEGPTFVAKVDGENDQIVISLPAGAEYKTYVMTTTYETLYGNITLTATLKLSYPEDLLRKDMTQWVNNAFVLNASKPASGDNEYVISDNLSKAYTSIDGVDYQFSLVKKSAVGEYVAVESGDKLPVSIVDNVITIRDKVDLTGFWVKATAMIGTHATINTEYFHVQATFPISTNVITCSQKDNTFTYTPGGTVTNLAEKLSFKDRFSKELIVAGVVQEYAKTAYGMDEELTYTIVSVDNDGNVANYIIDGGKFKTVDDYDSAVDITVTVKVSVKHNFGPESSATLTVKVAKTK